MLSTSPARAPAGDAIPTVSADTFETLILEAAGPVVVEFMSYGCAHCRVLEPVLKEVARRLALEAQCFRVNVALDAALAAKLRISATPTLVLFAAGREVGRLDGPAPAVESLLAAIRPAFET